LKNLRRNHHFVSQSYLKAWANNHQRIWAYRILVSHSSVPLWSQVSVKSVANQQHLFTRSIVDTDSDEIEIWMDQEIETPAQVALSKARSNEPLDAQEWECLLRFVALHHIRSPANYIESMERWKSEMPNIIEGAMQSAVSKIQAHQNQSYHPPRDENPDINMIPMMVTKEINDKEWGHLKAEVLLGRGLWLFSIRHTMLNTYRVLNMHTWSILRAPEGMEWLTSDNPVVRLNYYGVGSYDFKGGWGNDGSEIIFPLSPKLLLYTQVGNKSRLNAVSKELALSFNQFIAENAYRHIFGSYRLDEISNIHPRIVDKEAYESERWEWETWHLRQKELEKGYQRIEE